jgi:predicted alpha/beta-hydrolase family hydrolase
MDFLFDGPARARATLVLAHGAGTAMDHPSMQGIAERLAGRRIRVARFEFPYMAARRQGRRGPPDREPVLRRTWLEAIEAVGGGRRVAIGGRSMGGRIASMVADEAGVRALVCLGYPFHPTGRPERTRVTHLEALQTPALIVQGERDAFGTPEDVRGYKLSRAIRIEWLPDADHSFRPRKASGFTLEEHMETAARLAADFVRAQFGA